MAASHHPAFRIDAGVAGHRPLAGPPSGMLSAMAHGRDGGPIDWLFRDRKTGRITIAQFPNAALWVFLAATVLRWLFDPAGDIGTGLQLLAAGALIWWAAEELVRGVNPWRRLLGGAVLAAQAAELLG